MSFFNLSDGKNAAQTGTDFEVGGGEPIPDNTKLLAIIDETGWKDMQETGEWYINARWTVLQPAEYKNRKVFQKLRVEHEDAKKSDNAKRMLAAIDANAGGKLAQAGQRPDDQMLMSALVNKPMVICVKVWELDSGAKGNWVCAVSARQQGQAAPQAAPQATPGTFDDVPF